MYTTNFHAYLYFPFSLCAFAASFFKMRCARMLTIKILNLESK